MFIFFFSSRRRHTRWPRDWSSDVCSSDLFIGGGILFKCNEPIHSTLIPALDQKTLGMLPPAHIRVRERFNQRTCSGILQIQRFFSLPAFVDNPVNSSMLTVTKRIGIRIAGGRFLTITLRVVLDDIVVPVGYPNLSVRTYFSHDRAEPLLISGNQVPGVLRTKALPFFFKHHLGKDRKSTRLNSSHVAISYAVFCLKK